MVFHTECLPTLLDSIQNRAGADTPAESENIMDRELKELLEQKTKERKVILVLNCNCEGCDNGEFEIVDLEDACMLEDVFCVYHGSNKDEAMIAIMRYARNAEERH